VVIDPLGRGLNMRWSEAFDADVVGRRPQVHQQLAGGLSEAGRAAEEADRDSLSPRCRPRGREAATVGQLQRQPAPGLR